MDKDKLPEQGKTDNHLTDQTEPKAPQTEPKAPESGPQAPAAFSELAKEDEEIKAGTARAYQITPSGLKPLPSNIPNYNTTKVYRAKSGKWEYMHVDGNPGPPVDGEGDDATLPDKDKST